MSVKKHASTGNKKRDSQISQALKDIPATLMRERTEQENDQRTPPPTKTRVPVYTNPPQSSRWLWMGVSLFMIAIVLMWGLNLSSILFDNKYTTDASEMFIETSKRDVTSIFKTFQEREQLTTPTTTEEIPPPDTTTSSESIITETLRQLFAPTSTTSTNE